MKNLKRILFIALLFIGMFSIQSCCDDEDMPTGCLPANLEEGVIAFYPFSTGSLDDESSNSNHLINTTTASPTSDRLGNANCAYLFNNPAGSPPPTVEFLTTANTSFLNGLNEFSVSLWYEPHPIPSFWNYEVLLSRGNTPRCPDRNGEWSVSLYDCRRAVFGHNNSVWANFISMGGCNDEALALTNNWHNVVATKNGSDYKIYFNGVLDDSASGSAGCLPDYIAQDIGDLFIGSYYTGKIDDILIYNRELSQAEVTELYQLEPCCQ